MRNPSSGACVVRVGANAFAISDAPNVSAYDRALPGVSFSKK